MCLNYKNMVLLSIFSLGNLLGVAAGFILGALVFRNNKAAGEKVVQDLKDELQKLKDKANIN